MTTALVTANAAFNLPAGSKMSDEPNTIVCPNGDKLKFWVACELVATDMDPEVYETLTEAQLSEMGMDVEHDATQITLVELSQLGVGD